MCGRIIQSSTPLRLAIVEGLDVSDRRMGNIRPRYNGSPSQELMIIRENHKTGERSLDLIKWGLTAHWCRDLKGGRRPINAKAETIAKLPMFREAYAQRRCIVPVDGFFEWRAIRGARAKQPYAIVMKDGSPFGLAGLWENWRFRSFGFPGAGDIGNMFQFWADFNDLYCANRSVEFSRSLNPELQTLDQWMAANKDRIPLGGAG